MSNESEYWLRTKAELARETDLSTFKTWKVVRSIPIYKDNEFPATYPTEVRQMLRQRPDRELRLWKTILKEPFLGHTDASYAEAQIPFMAGVSSTSWVLKSAHHVLVFEALAGHPITDYEQIVEFGAGIGETARLITDLGFSGDYYILDLPETGRLSNFYLESRGVKVREQLGEIPRGKTTLLIATWSLSEVPMSYRNEVTDYFKGADWFVIFQKEIFGYDNYNYFTQEFPTATDTTITLHPIVWHKGAGGNWYLYAANKSRSRPSAKATQAAPRYSLPPVSEHRTRVAMHILRRIPKVAWRRRPRLLMTGGERRI